MSYANRSKPLNPKYGNNGSAISVTKKAVDQAEENFKVAMDRYRSGLGTYTEVLDAETRRSKIRNNCSMPMTLNPLERLYLRHEIGRAHV